MSELTAFDTETELIRPDLPAPPMVCGQFYSPSTGALLMTPPDAIAEFRRRAERGDVFCGVNIFFDLRVLVTEDPTLLPLIFLLLDEGRVLDLPVLEALHDNAIRTVRRDKETGAPIADSRMYEDDAGKPIRYSLAFLAQRHLGLDLEEEKTDPNSWRFNFSRLRGVPLSDWPASAVEYALHDVEYPWKIAQKQLAPGRYNLQCSADAVRDGWFLSLAHLQGIDVDGEMAQSVIDEIVLKHVESRRRFVDLGIVKVKRCKPDEAEPVPTELIPERMRGKPVCYGESRKRLQELVTAAYSGTPPLSAKTGLARADRDTLQGSDNPDLVAYAEDGTNEKLYSTFVDYLKFGKRIHPNFTVIVSSWRASYSKPNLQQLPRKGRVRHAFVPPPGKVLCSVDYSGIESVHLAAVNERWFGFSRMADALRAGEDLHVRMGSRLVARTYAELDTARKRGEKWAKNARQLAKAVNYGLPGAMGPAKLVYSARKDGTETTGPDGKRYHGTRFCILSGQAQRCGERTTVYQTKKDHFILCSTCLDLAQSFYRMYFEEFPEMRLFHDRISKLTNKGAGATIKSAGNGLLRFCGFTDAANHQFQNPAAQGAKKAGYALVKEAALDKRSPLYNRWAPALFLHDEILAVIDEDVAHEAAYRQAEVMCEVMQRFCGTIPVKAEPALQRRWFKDAEPAFDSKGRLRPWWPAKWDWAADREQMEKDLAK